MTFSVVAVADPIAVHHKTTLFVRSFGGTTSSSPGGHVQMTPFPPEDAIDACRMKFAGIVGATPQPAMTVEPKAAGAAGSCASPTTCVPVVGVFAGRPIPKLMLVEAPEAQKTSISLIFARGVVAAPGCANSMRTPAAETDAEVFDVE